MRRGIDFITYVHPSPQRCYVSTHKNMAYLSCDVSCRRGRALGRFCTNSGCGRRWATANLHPREAPKTAGATLNTFTNMSQRSRLNKIYTINIKMQCDVLLNARLCSNCIPLLLAPLTALSCAPAPSGIRTACRVSRAHGTASPPRGEKARGTGGRTR